MTSDRTGSAEDFHPRPTFGTNMAEAGVDAHVLKELMGHRNIDSTQVYVHLSPSHLRRQYDDAQARIRGGEGRA
jgi:integrase/recombinase XerD